MPATNIDTHFYMHVYTHIYTNVHTHTYAHVHTHTYVHVYTPVCNCSMTDVALAARDTQSRPHA